MAPIDTAIQETPILCALVSTVGSILTRIKEESKILELGGKVACFYYLYCLKAKKESELQELYTPETGQYNMQIQNAIQNWPIQIIPKYRATRFALCYSVGLL